MEFKSENSGDNFARMDDTVPVNVADGNPNDLVDINRQPKKKKKLIGLNANSDHEKFMELLTCAIIRHDLPFQFPEWSGIRDSLLYLRGDLSTVTRDDVKATCLKLYKRERERLLAMFRENNSRVSLTFDLWTSLNTDEYICLTAHFVDKNWHVRKRVLNFGFMPPPLNEISLAEKILRSLRDWGLNKKIFSITSNNASTNDACVGILRRILMLGGGLACEGQFFHLHCCAHILNSIVQEGLKEVDNCVIKVRESIKYVKGSQAAKKSFLECVACSPPESKRGLRQDVPHRWSSTFLMLDGAFLYRQAFMNLEFSDSDFKHCPSRDEWEKIEKINKFLSVFYNITRISSDTKHSTANRYFPLLFVAHLTLRDGLKSEDAYINKMATNMFTRFNKYWADFSMILAIAVVLDPRYKMTFIEWCYSKLFGDDGIIEATKVKNKLNSLFNEYVGAGIYTSSGSTGASSCNARAGGTKTPQQTSSSTFFINLLSEFDSFDEAIVSQKSQLELYLEDPRIDRTSNLDILAYWRAEQCRYPKVAAMARDIFGMPIACVASEAAFSAEGRVLDQYKSSLKPNIVEALVCTRDWLYGEHEHAVISLEELTEDIMEVEMPNDYAQNSFSAT